ncbi:MAG TPA: gamma-glutamyl-gamma-aminobutyrate hydrolase family protein, partial [Bacteroidota bacterium]|nr:gamma-glutamyl-gamma-aminobutyrate hydrolase family protein [Bacteroidota bacterium]
VAIEANSLLSGLAGGLTAEVNSSHHQAVRELGRGLMPAARSADGVIEAAEWSLKERMPFLLLVQWHPERMMGNAFSTNLARIFLRETQYHIANKTT